MTESGQNQMFEPTDEQQRTNDLEAKCFYQEDGNNLDVKPPCEVCDSQNNVQLYNLFGQRLRNDLPYEEIFQSDWYLCPECYKEKYPNGSGKAPIRGRK